MLNRCTLFTLLSCLTVLSLSILTPLNARALELEWAFEAPASITGTPGETVEFDAYVLITEVDIGGMQGFSVSVNTDNSANCSIAQFPKNDPQWFSDTVSALTTENPPGIVQSGFRVAEEDTASNTDGFVAAVVFSFVQPITVTPNMTPARLIHFRVSAVIPSSGTTVNCPIQFINGLQGSGQPVTNVGTINGGTVAPTLSNALVQLTGDSCPTDPNKLLPGGCGCGIPDTDSDSDGTLDCVDLCPTDAGKILPGVCGCGAPDSDTDLDGTSDCNDPCVTDAGKILPGVCGCGVPDTDLDGSGVIDCLFTTEATVAVSSITSSLESLRFKKGRKARKEIRTQLTLLLQTIEALGGYFSTNASSLFTTRALTAEEADSLIAKLQKQVRRLRKKTKNRKTFNRAKRKAIKTASEIQAGL